MLEQKPHVSEGDESPTKSKGSKNGNTNNKFFISPTSGTFTFGGIGLMPAIPTTDLTKRKTYSN